MRLPPEIHHDGNHPRHSTDRRLPEVLQREHADGCSTAEKLVDSAKVLAAMRRLWPSV